MGVGLVGDPAEPPAFGAAEGVLGTPEGPVDPDVELPGVPAELGTPEEPEAPEELVEPEEPAEPPEV